MKECGGVTEAIYRSVTRSLDVDNRLPGSRVEISTAGGRARTAVLAPRYPPGFNDDITGALWQPCRNGKLCRVDAFLLWRFGPWFKVLCVTMEVGIYCELRYIQYHDKSVRQATSKSPISNAWISHLRR